MRNDLQAVARHEGERRFEEVEPAECRKLIEHEKNAVTSNLEVFRVIAGRSG